MSHRLCGEPGDYPALQKKLEIATKSPTRTRSTGKVGYVAVPPETLWENGKKIETGRKCLYYKLGLASTRPNSQKKPESLCEARIRHICRLAAWLGEPSRLTSDWTNQSRRFRATIA